MLRLFVALRPPPPIRDLLLATMSGVAGARWQDAAQLHLTLCFIGEVDERTAEDIDTALGSILSGPITLRIDGVGRFEARGRATALWARPCPHDALTRLHRKVDAAVVRAGLGPERRSYLPHITVARLNTASGPVERWLHDHERLTSEAWMNTDFGLFSSTTRTSACSAALRRALVHATIARSLHARSALTP